MLSTSRLESSHLIAKNQGFFFCSIYARRETIVDLPSASALKSDNNYCRFQRLSMNSNSVALFASVVQLFNCWSDQRRPLPLQSTVLSYTVITDSFLLFFFFFLVRLLAPSAAAAADCSSSMHLHQQQCMCTCVCVCFGLNLAVCLCVWGKQARWLLLPASIDAAAAAAAAVIDASQQEAQ